MTERIDYTKLDIAIITAIENGKTRFQEIWPAVEKVAKQFNVHCENDPTWTAHHTTRMRLSYMSKNGQLKSNRKHGWSVL